MRLANSQSSQQPTRRGVLRLAVLAGAAALLGRLQHAGSDLGGFPARLHPRRGRSRAGPAGHGWAGRARADGHTLDRLHGGESILVLHQPDLAPPRRLHAPGRSSTRRVAAIYFTPNLRVERKALYGLEDGVVFDFISRETPTAAPSRGFGFAPAGSAALTSWIPDQPGQTTAGRGWSGFPSPLPPRFGALEITHLLRIRREPRSSFPVGEGGSARSAETDGATP